MTTMDAFSRLLADGYEGLTGRKANRGHYWAHRPNREMFYYWEERPVSRASQSQYGR